MLLAMGTDPATTGAFRIDAGLEYFRVSPIGCLRGPSMRPWQRSAQQSTSAGRPGVPLSSERTCELVGEPAARRQRNLVGC